ncbi:class A beta-lactamase [Brevundimonas sp. UBA2416]|uniref:class A beta-lactamase n=1 Tax=Brevundimonas sp. UBA2416 TaxID=1946124 RepID=UPI0025C0AD95|nr:class A beta-lactamase [Brevundimonas sp. UBA2416]HRJ63040.1 class A beta-lactamase [Brevundimonas sp.]
MTEGADRRSVLTGLGALGLTGCEQQDPQPNPPLMVVPTRRVDFSSLEARHGGRIGIDAWSEKGAVSWRGRERFVYCSTFKMYLAAATLLRVQAGEESLDRQVPITSADMINHAPVTDPAIGGTLTIDQLMKGTVEVSDNPAANILIRELGGLDALRAFYRGIGDTSTRVDRLEPEMNRLDGDKDTIQPAQSRINLYRLFEASETPLSPSSKEKLLGWMFASPTGVGRIKAGVPVGWRVAHKTGTGGYGPTNDIGLLYPPTGTPITLAVYYHGVRASSDAENEAVIADATRLTLSALGYA